LLEQVVPEYLDVSFHVHFLVKAVPTKLQNSFLASLLTSAEQSFAKCIIPTNFLVALLRHHEVRHVENLEHHVQQLEFHLNTNRKATMSILHELKIALPNDNQALPTLLLAKTASTVWTDLRANDRKRKISKRHHSASIQRRIIMSPFRQETKPTIDPNQNQSFRFHDLLG
jgi:hypothetical protein